MKKSLSHLPEDKQDNFWILAKLIEFYFPPKKCEKIILYGSYARGDYNPGEWKNDYDVPVFLRSDYDIMILHSSRHISEYRMDELVERAVGRYERQTGDDNHVQYLIEHIDDFNQKVTEGRYFYTTILREGILLYDKGTVPLASTHVLKFREILDLSKEYYEERMDTAETFLENASHNYDKGKYKMASFGLHQATENYLHTISLVFTQDKSQEHNLAKLLRRAKSHAMEEITPLFPRRDSRGRRLFTLLNQAYTRARYDSKFKVSKKNIEALTPMVEELREAAKLICERQIAHYEACVKGRAK